MNLTLNSKERNLDTHLDPKEWNELIKKKDTHIIDTRKPFEFDVGTFKKSVNPDVNNFRDFPKYLNKLKKDKPVAMFCTGGIRCEKTSVYLKKKGFKNIYQLNGGILNYLKKTKEKDSLWKGECFVFDNRISLKHGLKLELTLCVVVVENQFLLKIKNLRNMKKVFLAQIVTII